MSVLIVIPARYASSRFPGKPLVPITGPEGVTKTLIERSWDAAMAVSGVDRVVIATDDDRIKTTAEGFGAEVVMTSEQCQNGTERCADVLRRIADRFEIVVNLQGDAPLTPPWFVEELISGLRENSWAQIATPVLATDGATLRRFQEDRAAGRVGGTTAVFDRNYRALYFSKEVIPFLPKNYASDAQTPVFHHVGVYAYRPEALEAYNLWAAGPLEKNEGLEQLRFLENGEPVLCVLVDARGRIFWEVNNPEDVERVEMVIKGERSG
ncbi:MAG: 3-deoxy-manno-octulosonate cytidylyltransferase [Pseudomonadota bacterium]